MFGREETRTLGGGSGEERRKGTGGGGASAEGGSLIHPRTLTPAHITVSTLDILPLTGRNDHPFSALSLLGLLRSVPKDAPQRVLPPLLNKKLLKKLLVYQSLDLREFLLRFRDLRTSLIPKGRTWIELSRNLGSSRNGLH